ncbi:MAG: type III-B CRISPR module-associated protein Cmr5 [Zetaproteobacteria bacterium]|nr:MAG: type III-B CRISPR module-associated protein Cmr5 [Zetaproteobacteria bacterium]
MRTMDQQRAEYAWEHVRGRCAKDYANLAKSMPAMVMTNGLMPTLAFLEGKGDAHHRRLLSDVLGWLIQRQILESEPDFRDAMEQLRKMSAREYQRATEETLAILKWIRHFADAVKE